MAWLKLVLPLIFQLKENVAGFLEIHKKMLVRLKSGVNSIAIQKGDLNG
jgi:flagellar assembly factor FliW